MDYQNAILQNNVLPADRLPQLLANANMVLDAARQGMHTMTMIQV